MRIDVSRRGRSIAHPSRQRRVPHVAPLLGAELQPGAGPETLLRHARIDRGDDAVVLGRVLEPIAVGNGKRSGGRLGRQARIAAVVAVEDVHVAHADRGLDPAHLPEAPLVRDVPFDLLQPVPALARFERVRADAVEEPIRPVHLVEAELQRPVLVEQDALLQGRAEPVVRPRLGVQGEVVPLEPRVVPEGVDADAGLEVELGEGDREDACLVVGAEREEVVDLREEIDLFRRGDGGGEGGPEDVLADDVCRGQHDARDPEEPVTRGRGLGRAAVVGRHRALRRCLGGRLGRRAVGVRGRREQRRGCKAES